MYLINWVDIFTTAEKSKDGIFLNMLSLLKHHQTLTEANEYKICTEKKSKKKETLEMEPLFWITVGLSFCRYKLHGIENVH